MHDGETVAHGFNKNKSSVYQCCRVMSRYSFFIEKQLEGYGLIGARSINVMSCSLRVKDRAGKEKIRQHLYEIVARPLLPTLIAPDHKSEESASIRLDIAWEMNQF